MSLGGTLLVRLVKVLRLPSADPEGRTRRGARLRRPTVSSGQDRGWATLRHRPLRSAQGEDLKRTRLRLIPAVHSLLVCVCPAHRLDHAHCDHCRVVLPPRAYCYRTYGAGGRKHRGRVYCEPCGEFLQDAPGSRLLHRGLASHKPAVLSRIGVADSDGPAFERETRLGKPAV